MSEAPRKDKQAETTEAQIEALSREVERLGVLASREHGLVEAILTHSPHGILVSDKNGKLTLHNKAAERIWAGSATAENIAGWGKYRAFHADGRPYEPTDWAMAHALRHRETVQPREIHIQRFDDTHGVLLGGAAPIFGADGELEGALSVFADISEFKRQEEEIRISAERYFITLKSIGDAVIATDARGCITFLNTVAEALTGWQSESARGKPLGDVFRVVDEKTRAVLEGPFARVTRAGKIGGLPDQTLLIARDGREVAVDDSCAPIHNAKQELAGVVLVFRDVTEKRREEARRRFIAEASTLLASSRLDYVTTLTRVARLSVPTIADWCTIDMVGAEGKLEQLVVEHVEPAKVRLAKELEQRYPTDPSSPHGAHEVVRTGRARLLSEISDRVLEIAARDREHLDILRELGLKSLMIVPLRCRGVTLGAITFVSAESGRAFGAVDLDLAEELASVAALAVENARLYREAQEANRAKDEFLATVSHELRTPLNAIMGWASLLAGGELAEDKRSRAVEVIERNARAQAKLIEDLLDVSRIISGTLRIDIGPIDLVSIVEAAVDSIRPAADAKGVELRVRFEDGARHATGDAGRLRQVVWNLLSNAVKFSERCDVVTVHLTRPGSLAEVAVTDTGQGIEVDFLPHIFERFRQGKATTTRSEGGLGLGLAIVKHLVELHGGSVGAESAGPGKGSTFRVKLPLSAVALRNALPSSPGSRLVAPSLDGLRVLIVDDDPDARALLIEILSGHGARVTAAASAAEALREVEREFPDVLVSDIGMPGEDGYSLIRKLRALTTQTQKSLPAAALTAFARKQDRTRALLAGFQAHIAKPVEPEELLIVVATLAGRTGGGVPPAS